MNTLNDSDSQSDDVDAPPVPLGDRPDDRQAEAGAAVSTPVGWLPVREALEDPLPVGLGHAGAGVDPPSLGELG